MAAPICKLCLPVADRKVTITIDPEDIGDMARALTDVICPDNLEGLGHALIGSAPKPVRRPR